jgi:hypothetical protein
MRRHHDQVAPLGLGGVDNRLVRMLMLHLYRLARHARCFGRNGHILQCLGCVLMHALAILFRRIFHGLRLERKNAERRRNRQDSDFGLDLLAKSNAGLHGFVGQFRTIRWDQNIFVHAARLSRSRRASICLWHRRSGPLLLCVVLLRWCRAWRRDREKKPDAPSLYCPPFCDYWPVTDITGEVANFA